MTNLLGLSGIFKPSDEVRKLAAWNNVPAIPVLSPGLFPTTKIDCDGRIIKWSEYGQNSENGWHIDHAHELALGGPDELHNLRARHWYGNTRAGGLLGSALSKVRR